VIPAQRILIHKKKLKTTSIFSKKNSLYLLLTQELYLEFLVEISLVTVFPKLQVKFKNIYTEPIVEQVANILS